MSEAVAEVCPCGSGDGYAACCEPLHAGRPASTAEALMRSRYSAFALGLPEYLFETWHASTRPRRVELDDDIRWRRLQIVDIVDGGVDDEVGIVEFRASYLDGSEPGLLHARSRFGRVLGRWTYLGEVTPTLLVE